MSIVNMKYRRTQIPLLFRCRVPNFRCHQTRPKSSKGLIRMIFLLIEGLFRKTAKFFPALREGPVGGSIRQVKEFAPAVRIDVALDDFAGSRRAKQGAGRTGEATLWPVLIRGVGLRHLLLRQRPGDANDDERAENVCRTLRRNSLGEAFDNCCARKLASHE
jgi:hypothetical protein